MIFPYVVTIRNRQTRVLDLIGILLSLLSVVSFTRELIAGPSVGLAYLVGAIAVMVVVAWNLYVSLKKKKKVYYSRALLLAALVWMKMPWLQWISLVLIVLALLEYQAKYSVEIGFSTEEIVMNTFLKKRFAWGQFNGILLKDGILTMDFKSNRVWQLEVEDDEEDDADEDEFNQWCRGRLAQANKPATT